MLSQSETRRGNKRKKKARSEASLQEYFVRFWRFCFRFLSSLQLNIFGSGHFRKISNVGSRSHHDSWLDTTKEKCLSWRSNSKPFQSERPLRKEQRWFSIFHTERDHYSRVDLQLFHPFGNFDARQNLHSSAFHPLVEDIFKRRSQRMRSSQTKLLLSTDTSVIIFRESLAQFHN